MPFTRIHASFVLGISMALWGSALILSGVMSDHWFETTTTESSLRIGLSRVCTDTICLDHNYTANVTLDLCIQSGSQLKFRMKSVEYALYATVGAAGLSSLITTLSVCLATTKLLYLGQFMLALAFCGSFLALTFFYASMERWLWCDKSYCDFYELLTGSGRPCYYFYGISFALSSGGVVLYLLSTLWCGFTVVAAATADDDEDEEDEDASDSDSEKKVTPQKKAAGEEEKTTSNEPTAATAKVAADIPDGYTWDEASGYYYSVETEWYYDADSNMFCDDNGVWFDRT